MTATAELDQTGNGVCPRDEPVEYHHHNNAASASHKANSVLELQSFCRYLSCFLFHLITLCKLHWLNSIKLE
jgi:hypothetical protein